MDLESILKFNEILTGIKQDISSLKSGQILPIVIGNVLTFVFVLLAAWLRERQNIKTANFKAPHRIEFACNKILNSLSDQRFVIKDITKGLHVVLESGQMAIIPKRTHPISTYNMDNLLTDLLNTDFLNQTFNYLAGLEKTNVDLSTLAKTYEELQTHLVGISQTPGFQSIVQGNYQLLIEKMGEIDSFLEDLEDQTKKVAAASRRLKKLSRPFTYRLLGFRAKHVYPPDWDDQMKSEIAKLENEIKESESKDSERIERIKE